MLYCGVSLFFYFYILFHLYSPSDVSQIMISSKVKRSKLQKNCSSVSALIFWGVVKKCWCGKKPSGSMYLLVKIYKGGARGALAAGSCA